MKMKTLISDTAHHPGRNMLQFRPRTLPLVCGICGALLFGLALLAESALAQEETKAAPKPQSGENLGEVGAKLANPLGSLWSLVFNFETPKFFDGNLNTTGDHKIGANVIFQPVLPIPLYGRGKEQWRLITRPVIPFIFSQPDPGGLSLDTVNSRPELVGLDDFDHKGGIGDIQLPALLALPGKYAGNWILGAGPVFLFPTATTDALGSN